MARARSRCLEDIDRADDVLIANGGAVDRALVAAPCDRCSACREHIRLLTLTDLQQVVGGEQPTRESVTSGKLEGTCA